MQRPPWWYWLQWRDLVPVLISMLVLVGFLSVSTWLFGQSVVLVLNHIRKAWDHP